MKYLQKIKKILTEYWELFLGFLVLLVGIVIGTSGSREKVLKSDLKAKDQARNKIIKETSFCNKTKLLNKTNIKFS